MIKVKNKIIPFGKFKVMAIYPFVFYKGDELRQKTINHESIHFKQQKECLIIPFYILYFIFWLIYGYRNIPFEREAINNDHKSTYLVVRKRFEWIKYI